MHRKFFSRTLLLSAGFALLFSASSIKAIAHYAPEEDSDDTTTTTTNRRWDNWNSDTDRRWRRNWAPWDYDRPVYQYPVNYPYATCPGYQSVQVNQPASPSTCASGQINECSYTPTTTPNIPNFHQVHNYLYRGGQPTASNLAQLYRMGVRTVVNLRSDPPAVESERQLCEQQNLKYVNIPLITNSAPSDQDVCKFMDVVDSARENPSQGSVFVHDQYGADRVGCMVGIYRELADKFSYGQAYSEMLQYGFHDNFTNLKEKVQSLASNIVAPRKEVPATKTKLE
jgi:protein tyrosine phosphatase (PTP) superfamily phosphohydrolase (DUF442 family)